MFYRRLQVNYCTYFIFLEISFLHAQKGTSIDEGGVSNLVKSRFFDPANMGFPNFAPGRFGSLGSNYPARSPFLPFGNQFSNFQSRPNLGWAVQNQYTNQENFQRPLGGLNQNQGFFPNQRGIFRAGLNGILDSTNHDMNTDQNNPRNSVPDDVSLLFVNKPHQNRGSNLQPSQNNGGELPFPVPSGQTPIQDGHFVQDSNYYQNTRPQLPNRPINYLSKNTQHPGNNRLYQNKHQYPAQINFPESRNPNLLTKSNAKPQPPYTSDFSSLQNSQNNQRGLNRNHSVHNLNQNPINRDTRNNYGFNFNEGNFKDAHQYLTKIPDQNQHTDSYKTDTDRKVAILGKPVIIPPETTERNYVDEASLKNAVKKQCVQDCVTQTSSEYNPICGTNNETYLNPGKFTCARNCGVNVQIKTYSKCNV